MMEFLETDQRLERREMCEMLLNRAEFLDPPDQALLKQVLERGSNATEIAQLTGQHPRTVQHRVRKLLARLARPDVVAILRHHEQWDTTTAKVAMHRWIRQWTLRQTADDLQITLHDVRKRVIAVKTLLREMGIKPVE